MTMIPAGHAIIVTLLRCILPLSMAYTAGAIVLVFSFAKHRAGASAWMPPVTILKPLCGLEPGLLDSLRSFCEQDYPKYQIVFGVRTSSDAVLPILDRLEREYPDRDIMLVVDGRLHGSNRKMSNLANMLGAARYDILVISDSDIRVAPDYLRAAVEPFFDRKVGAATSLYTGTPSGGFPSVLGAMFINEWFLPAVLVSVALSKLSFCFGQTMAVRRSVLDSVGGFRGLAPYLADDYMLGKLVSDQGLEVRLVEAGVENVVSDTRLASLLTRELRWFRTYRAVRPWGYAFTVLTDTTALALLYLIASGFSILGFSLLAATTALRIGLHEAVSRRFGTGGGSQIWLVPIRDLLNFAIRVRSFFSRHIEWKGEQFVVLSSGKLETRREIPV
jgi:ceramide glucosyltransferase